MFPRLWLSGTGVKVAALGPCSLDIFKRQKKVFPGGNSLNVAVQAARAGAKASLVSAVGKDVAGSRLLRYLKSLAVDVSQVHIENGETDTVEITLDKEKSPLYGRWTLGVLKTWKPDKNDERYVAQHQAAISVLLQPIKHIFDRFIEMKLPETLKIADFTDLSEYNYDLSVMEKYLPLIDIACISTKEEQLSTLKEYSDNHDKLIVCLLGPQGSQVYFKNRQYRQRAYPAKVTDTTGAGDAYLATFAVNYLQNGNIPRAMSRAAKAAVETVSHFGAISHSC